MNVFTNIHHRDWSRTQLPAQYVGGGGGIIRGAVLRQAINEHSIFRDVRALKIK